MLIENATRTWLVKRAWSLGNLLMFSCGIDMENVALCPSLLCMYIYYAILFPL